MVTPQASTSVSGRDVDSWLRRLAALVGEFRDALNSLDAAAGDGDIGDNLVRGFTAAGTTVPPDGRPAAVLGALGDALLNRMGGSSGTLVGMAIRDALRDAEDVPVWTLDEVVAVAARVQQSVGRRGRSAVGDRTLLDALEPAVQRAEGGAAAGPLLADDIFDAAVTGLHATRSLVPLRGRSSYIGERAMGHPDAGAFFVVLACAALDPSLGATAVRRIDLSSTEPSDR